MTKRPVTTLFMLQSLDGKITSGDSDDLDADKDWPKIKGVREGLYQYYEIEKTTDLCSLNTGRTMAKIGVNERRERPPKSPCTFIIVDNKPHLNLSGINYLTNWVSRLIIVTVNKNHPAFLLKSKADNLEILFYKKIDLKRMQEDLYAKYKIKNITIQSGGTLNSQFLRDGLIDFVNIVIAPLLVGGKETSTLIDGPSIKTTNELNKLKSLKLLEIKALNNSYIQLRYKVNN